jgi:hypothetical protein
VDTRFEKGKEVEPSVNDAFRRAGDRIEDAGSRVCEFVSHRAGAAESALDERVAAALRRMGFPSRDEIADLSARIDALAARLDQMASRREPGA